MSRYSDNGEPPKNRSDERSQEPVRVEIHQEAPEERKRSGRGCLGNLAILIALGILIVIGLFILQSLGMISGELDQQTGLMQERNSILGRMEEGIRELVEAIREMGR
ncbi:hypothetical protein C8P63_12814 [Melghirimyces profundicolus]|uniref:Uncharacterized protein n=1 Tax=Melghirimyces profundicolus TaxID=1242148 RepID=A0A2T6BC81_9BACL|nr:hypothetical protein [Melghirimyces profundicolus]PTX53653.1 hypothetical protein C8P63_12814 [Melghirimyces profundicolus]